MKPINKIYNLVGKLNEDEWDLHNCGLSNIEEILRGRISQYSYIKFSEILNEDIKKEMKYYTFNLLNGYNQSISNLLPQLRTIIWFIKYLSSLKEGLLDFESLKDIDDEFCVSYIKYLNSHQITTHYKKIYNIDLLMCNNQIARFAHKIKSFLIDEYNKAFNKIPDIWYIKDFKIDPHRINLSDNIKSFRFYEIHNEHNKDIFKKYIKYLLYEREISVSFIQSKFTSVKYFLKAIGEICIDEIDRVVIEQYKETLLKRDIDDKTYNVRIFAISDFLDYCISIGTINYNHIYIEYDTLNSPLIIKGDIVEKHVIEQILNHSSDIPENYFLMFLILYCCGMRISEICILKIGCLKKDENGYYIVFYVQKMKKEASNPIPENLYYRILEYEKKVIEKFGKEQIYLFPRNDGMPMGSNVYKEKMQKVLRELDIRNSDGNMYIFRPHEYRHTFATKLVEKDIPFTVIQKLLHHSSPEMSLVYTQLSDSRKRRKYIEFTNIVGKRSKTLFESTEEAEKIYEVQWLKKNLKSQALPNGFCSLPVSLGQCPHANACLLCEHFKTTAGHLGILKKQLERTNELISILEERNLEKQLNFNIKVKGNLEKLINSIEEGGNIEES